MIRQVRRTDQQRAVIAGRKRDPMVKREANGRAQREHGPDRGTEELQARKGGKPIDLDDPIDIMHRRMKRLTDREAQAASIWRWSRAVVMAGEGPRLAMLRDPTGTGEGPGDSVVRRAGETLAEIEDELTGIRRHDLAEATRAVLDRRMGDPRAVRTVLAALAERLGLK